MSFIYTDNQQLKAELKALAVQNGVSMSDIAARVGIVPQQLNNKLANKRVSFSDMAEFLDTFGYQMKIDFIKKDE